MQDGLQPSLDIESALQEERFRLTFEQAGVGIAYVATDGRWILVNLRLCNILGYSREELQKLSFQDVTHPNDLDANLAHIQKLLSGEIDQCTAEKRYIRKDGTTVWVSLTVRGVRDAEGKLQYFVSVVEDISSRKKAEGALRESERRFREMIDALPAAIYTTDPEGRLTHFNPAAVEFSGRVPELGKDRWCVSWKMFRSDGSSLPHDQCPMATALQEGRILEGVEAISERPDGTRRWFTPFPRLVRDADGNVIGGINMLVDITARKQTEQATSLLAAIVDSSDDAIVSKNLDGVITSWNQGAERLFGFSAAEAIGRHITLIIPAERRAEETMILERLRRGERVDHFETVRMRKDGKLLDISLTISPMKDGTGRVVGASKVAHDITERKQAERNLGEAARQQRALFQLADRLHRALSTDQIHEAALDAIFDALHCNRAAILLGDDLGMMRFAVWRGLPESYRRAAEGHSPWSADEKNPQPVCVANVCTADLGKQFNAVLRSAGIGALAFIPLVSNGKLIGTFMTYFDAPHEFSSGEMELSLTIACQLAFGLDRRRAEEALLRSEGQLAKEADALAKLNDWTSRLWNTRYLEDGLNEMLSAVIELLGADKGSIHLLDAGRRMLVIAAQHGFEKQFLEYFAEIPSDDETAGGRALRLGQPVVIADVEADVAYARFRSVARSSAYRAVVSAPMIGTDGRHLGVLSTHFAVPHRPSNQDLHRLGLYVRQAADFIQRCKTEEELLESQQRLELALQASDAAAERERVLRVQAEAAGRLKDEFLATVSHELRTPLSAILGWASMIRRGLSADQALFPRAMEAIERNAKLQAQIVEDLLDVSRIISGKLLLDIKPLMLNGVVQAALDSVRPAADAKQIKLRVDIDDAANRLRADEARVQQIIWNLLSNSIKFTLPGGSVEVKVSRSDSMAEISVADTGEGIKPEFLPFVFDRFRQADASTTRKHTGLGLGLAIVRHLAEMHGGSVEAESEGEGCGAIFRVRLPLAPLAPGPESDSEVCKATDAPSSGTAALTLTGIKVLAVDDSEDTREVLAAVLGQRGADVITVGSSREALETMENWTPDILLCDIGMPGEDGYSFLKRLRTLERLKRPKSPGAKSGGNIPAIALTGYVRVENRIQAFRAGFQVFVPKPIDPDELVKQIATLLGHTTGAYLSSPS